MCRELQLVMRLDIRGGTQFKERITRATVYIRAFMDRLPGFLTMQAGQLVPADLAQPGKQGRLTPKTFEVAYRFYQAVLHHIFDASRIESGPPPHECGEPLGIRRKERVECRLLAGPHARDQPTVVLVHATSRAPLTGYLSVLDVIADTINRRISQNPLLRCCRDVWKGAW